MAERLVTRMDIEVSLAGPGGANAALQATAPALADLVALDRWEALPPVLQGFLLALSGDRLDGDTILVFADYLEENGRTEAGQRVRLLRPRPGDVIAVWANPPVGEPVGTEEAELASRVLAAVPHCLPIFLAPHEDRLEVMELSKIHDGWVTEEEAARRVRAEREACALLVERIGGKVDGAGVLAAYLAAHVRGRGDSA